MTVYVCVAASAYKRALSSSLPRPRLGHFLSSVSSLVSAPEARRVTVGSLFTHGPASRLLSPRVFATVSACAARVCRCGAGAFGRVTSTVARASELTPLRAFARNLSDSGLLRVCSVLLAIASLVLLATESVADKRCPSWTQHTVAVVLTVLYALEMVAVAATHYGSRAEGAGGFRALVGVSQPLCRPRRRLGRVSSLRLEHFQCRDPC